MNENLNIYVSACQGFDPESNSVIGLYDGIKVKDLYMDLVVFTGINYVGKENNAKFRIDYFLKCVEDKDFSGNNGKKIPLFAIEGSTSARSEEKETYMVHSSTFTQKQRILVPCSGVFEIQAYIMEKDMNMEDDPTERYRKYQEGNKLPSSAFKFIISKM
ncbi:MAG TPA: hypothetical protein DEB74_01365 [Lachnospiraceae bacterium]|nr:hypothetical protein [Lachnospiraceae bacterium]